MTETVTQKIERARAYLAATVTLTPDTPPAELLAAAAQCRAHLAGILAIIGGLRPGHGEPYGTGAELTALTTWIDRQLEDKTASRQAIAEQASARVKDITLQHRGAAELARQAQARAGAGPFETEREALDLPAIRGIYDAMHASTRRGLGDELCLRLLEEACAAAGVELGGYDRRILAWLAGWEAQMCAVVAGIITRAAAGAAS
ncbi:MAG TPA: hypothetical protein VMV92_39245 [Streptosporangiaceae bacterium]|nr:hypothetical protein [Streptosporangiaceae bacterium]